MELWRQRQQQENQPGHGEQILESLRLLGDQNRQRQLLELQKQQLLAGQAEKDRTFNQQQTENDYKYGKAIDPNLSVGVQTPMLGQPQSKHFPGQQLNPGTGRNLREMFDEWRSGGMKAAGARPEFMGALGQDERKQFYENANPKPTSPETPKAVASRPPNPQLVKAKGDLGGTRAFVRDTIAEIDRIEALNENSRGGLMGALTQKASSMLNVGTESPEFTNTADVVNTMQAQVARVLKSTFGGQLSDGERAYLNEVYGALPTLSPAERKIAMQNVKTMLKSKLSESESKFNELNSFLDPYSQQTQGGSDPLGLFQ